MSAERGTEKIVVEVKSFLNRSLTYDFYGAYGQFRFYRRGILKTDPESILFLAIPNDVYSKIELRSFYMELIEDEKIFLLIFNPLTRTIESWKK